MSIYFIYITLIYTHWKTWKDKRNTRQRFYIKKEFEYLCVATLGDGRVRSSFVVVRRKGRSSYSSYAIIKAPKKIQIKQIRGGNVFFFTLNGDGQLAKQKRRRGQTNPKKKMK